MSAATASNELLARYRANLRDSSPLVHSQIFRVNCFGHTYLTKKQAPADTEGFATVFSDVSRT
jgi:hypothetical protein